MRWAAILVLCGACSSSTGAGPVPDGDSCRVFVSGPATAQEPGITELTLDAASGRLAAKGSVSGLANPSCFDLTPDHRFIIAVNEVQTVDGKPDGGITSLAILPEGLRVIERVSSRGAGPCQLAAGPAGAIAVANYGGGTVAGLHLEETGAFEPNAVTARHQGHGLDPKRQDAPHPHCAAFSPGGRWLLVADLGIDRIVIYPCNRESGRFDPVAHASAEAGPGRGPRAIVFAPGGHHAFVVNELTNTVGWYAWDEDAGTLVRGGEASTLPADCRAPSFAGAAVLNPAGTRLYVTNRGHDSLATIEVDPLTGALTPLAITPSGGRFPWHLALTPDGRFLLVANREGSSIAPLPIALGSGIAGAATAVFDLGIRPSCVRILTP